MSQKIALLNALLIAVIKVLAAITIWENPVAADSDFH